MAFGDPVVQKAKASEERTEGEAVVATQPDGQFESTDDRGKEIPVPVDTISDKYKNRFDF